MLRNSKFAKAVNCPRCGATPFHQKWKPRGIVDFSDFTNISDCNPVDAIHCHRCDMVFRVSHFEHDDTYITSWDEMETIPRYCPWCGAEVCDEQR